LQLVGSGQKIVALFLKALDSRSRLKVFRFELRARTRYIRILFFKILIKAFEPLIGIPLDFFHRVVIAVQFSEYDGDYRSDSSRYQNCDDIHFSHPCGSNRFIDYITFSIVTQFSAIDDSRKKKYRLFDKTYLKDSASAVRNVPFSCLHFSLRRHRI